MLMLDAYSKRDLQTARSLLLLADDEGMATIAQAIELIERAIGDDQQSVSVAVDTPNQSKGRCPWCGGSMRLCGESSRLAGAPVYTCSRRCGYSVVVP